MTAAWWNSVWDTRLHNGQLVVLFGFEEVFSSALEHGIDGAFDQAKRVFKISFYSVK